MRAGEEDLWGYVQMQDTDSRTRGDGPGECEIFDAGRLWWVCVRISLVERYPHSK